MSRVILTDDERIARRKIATDKANKKYQQSDKFKKYSKITKCKYIKNKRKSDPQFRIASNLKCRLNQILQFKKRDRYIELIDCTVNQWSQHLQQSAIQNEYLDFDINNYNHREYHIDHIIPFSAFDLLDEEEVNRCCHWSNTQILKARDNIIKSNKILSSY